MSILSGAKAKRKLRETITACQRCDWDVEPAVLELHHRDRNRANNAFDNLILICPNCHVIDHLLAQDGRFSNNLGGGNKRRAHRLASHHP